MDRGWGEDRGPNGGFGGGGGGVVELGMVEGVLEVELGKMGDGKAKRSSC